MNSPIDSPEGLPEESYKLGDWKEEFVVTSWNLIEKGIFGILALLGGLICAILFPITFLISHERLAALVFLAIGAVGLFMAGCTLLARAFRNRGLRVLVFQEGLVRLQGKQADLVRWTEIKELRRVTTRGLDFRAGYPLYRILTRDGKTHEFDTFLPRITRLARILEKETLQQLLPQAVSNYRARRKIDFGLIVVEGESLNINNEITDWAYVKDIDLDPKESEVLIWRTKGKSFSRHPIGDIPNYHVLLALFDQIIGK